MLEARINRLWRVQVGHVHKVWVWHGRPVNVDAEQRLVVHLSEELGLIPELKVRAQSRVRLSSIGATLGIVVDIFRVQESGNPTR